MDWNKINWNSVDKKLEEKIESLLPGKDEIKKEKEAEKEAETQKTFPTIDTSAYPTSFVDQYRELENTRDMELQNAANARRNTFQSIMGNANTSGMMYSNFPERTKYQYDTATYRPAVVKANETFQTGLETLRDKITKGLNQLADYNDAIASLNKQYQSSNANSDLPSGAYTLNDAGDYGKQSLLDGGTAFYNSNGDPIRFGTTVKRANISGAEDILLAAKNALDENSYESLRKAYQVARAHGYPNIVVNAGDSFVPNNLDFLDDGQRGLMDSLGLTFAQ